MERERSPKALASTLARFETAALPFVEISKRFCDCKHSTTIEKVRNKIRKSIQTIVENTLNNVYGNIETRWSIILKEGGVRFEQLLS